jgi:acid phosphatase type 7
MLAALACVSCGGSPVGPEGTPSPRPVPPGPIVPLPGPIPGLPQVFVGAGDIAQCNSNAEDTARLLDTIGGTVFTTGDNAYFHGNRENYRECYEPTWGRHKARTRPTPGNHEYESPGASAYFEYFGFNAGPPGRGYYSFDLGAWHAIALNSNIGVQRGSAQGAWLSDDLEASSAFRCTIAYWHHPLFSSGPNGDGASMRDFWRMLYDAGVEIVLNGHDHLYERFEPQDPDGRPDPARGIRQFTVGSGGANLYGFATPRPNSQIRLSAYGVLKLTLSTDAYEWEFIPVSGPRDSGSGRCH